MKKGLFAAFIIACAMFVSGCCMSHEFTPASCTAPATCVKCGKTEGLALGHDYAEALCTVPMKCRICQVTEGEALGHDWQAATCTLAKTCTRCSNTEGDALGHTWKDATCTTPKTCSVCNSSEGEANGHSVIEWKTDKEPSCTEKGKESGICTVCSNTVEQDIKMTEHREGEWETTVMPTKDSKGTRCKYCVDCGKLLKSEQFSLSADELKSLYIEQCKSISYDTLSRYPGDYEGEYVRFSGTVVQVCSEASSALYYSTYRVATYGGYDDVIYIYVDNYGSGRRILEDDRITFYGTFGGLYTYETVMGASVTIPKIYVEYID